MKALLLKLLLGRGVDKLTELTGKALRHAVGAAGGALVAGGLASADQVATLEGAALVVTAIGASALRTFLAHRIAP